MEKKEIREFSIPAMLLVTGFCFLSFALVLRILDGVSMKFFRRTGFIIFLSGVLTGVHILIDKKKRRAINILKHT